MRKEQRLRTSNDFGAVRAARRTWSDRLLVLCTRPNGLDVTRFGFSVGRRVGIAVRRNKIKRRLQEVATHTQIGDGWDVVVIVRKGASDADFAALESSLVYLLSKAGISASTADNSVSHKATP